MTEDVFIIAIIFGTGAMITFVAMFYSLIKTWIKSRNSQSMSDQQLNAMQHDYKKLKQSVEKRLQNLEAIVVEEDEKRLGEKQPERLPKQSQSKSEPESESDVKKSENPLDNIEYSDESEGEGKNEQQSGRSSNLNNMLQN